jgi:surface antigen
VKRLASLALTALLLAGCASSFTDPGPSTQRPSGVFPQVVQTGDRLQCVAYARAETGLSIRGDAWDWWDLAAGRYGRSSEPERGAVLVLKGYGGNGRGHVAVVRRVLSGREIVEANGGVSIGDGFSPIFVNDRSCSCFLRSAYQSATTERFGF